MHGTGSAGRRQLLLALRPVLSARDRFKRATAERVDVVRLGPATAYQEARLARHIGHAVGDCANCVRLQVLVRACG